MKDSESIPQVGIDRFGIEFDGFMFCPNSEGGSHALLIDSL